jgi:hypothetical protein
MSALASLHSDKGMAGHVLFQVEWCTSYQDYAVYSNAIPIWHITLTLPLLDTDRCDETIVTDTFYGNKQHNEE